MTARETGRKIGRRLAAAGVPEAEFEAELLVRLASGLSRTDYFTGAEIPQERRAAMCSIVKRRVRREPFAYIQGTREFMGMDFAVTPDVLIPRPETELLVETAVRRAPANALIADIGTGSGCIAVSVARLRNDVRVVASDVSEAALAVARTNAAWLGASIEFVRGSLSRYLAPGSAREPLVVLANLPYIPTRDIDGLEPEVRDGEPRLALDGGADGLNLVRELIRDCGERLRPTLALFEIADGQAEIVAGILAAAGATSTEILPDLAGIGRVVAGEWR